MAAVRTTSKANLIDRVVGYFSPGAGLARVFDRDRLTRAYEGASKRDGWRPKRAGASANADHLADASELRTRARFLVQNVPYVARAISQLVAHTVGTGITPRTVVQKIKVRPGDARYDAFREWIDSDGMLDVSAAVDALWDRWSKVADADGLGDFYGLEARAYRAMEVDGEVLIRLRPRKRGDGLPVPLQIQLLEIDWLDSEKNGTAGPNTILNGIEYDPLGRIANYWIFDAHPGDASGFRLRGARTSRPVAASRIIHLFSPDRPGQGRGFTRLAPVIATVRDLSLYEDAEGARKNLETRLSVLASGDISHLSEDPGTESKVGDLGQLASGGITQIPAGVNLTVVEPKAAPGYVDYVKERKHTIAAGIGVTYEMMTGDMSETNFSSARVGQNDVRRGIEQVQWLTLVPVLLDRIRDAWFESARMAGLVPDGVVDRVDWSTPKWDYVNPLQEVNADNAEVQGGLCSISEKLRRRGYKPELVFSEMESDLKRLEKSGVLALLLSMKSGSLDAVMPAEDIESKPSKASK